MRGTGKFDYAMAFENRMSTLVSNVKRKHRSCSDMKNIP